MPNYLTSVLAAHVDLSQVQSFRHAKKVEESVDRAILKTWNEILKKTRSKSPTIRQDLTGESLTQDLYQSIARVMNRGLFQAVQIASKAAQQTILANVPVQVLTLAAEARGLKRGKRITTEARATPSQRRRIQNQLFDTVDEDRANLIVYRTTNGATWQRRLADATQLAHPQEVAKIVRDWAASQQSPRALETALMPVLQNVRVSARRVARTEAQRVATESRFDEYEKMGSWVIGYQIHGTMDARIRPHHAARNGTVYYRNPTLGQLSMEKDMPRPPIDEDGSLAHNCRCVVGNHKITANVFAISKSLYDGQAIEITTAYGAKLTITANHPVATQKGMVPADQITELDYLISDGVNVGDFANDIDNSIPTIEDVFQTLAIRNGIWTLGAPNPLDFHGDGQFMKGKVNIVFADGVLMNQGNSFGRHDRKEKSFVSGNCGDMSSPDLVSPGVLVHLSPLDQLSLRTAPRRDARIKKLFVKTKRNAFFGTRHSHTTTAKPTGFSNRVQGLSSQIPLNEIGRGMLRLGQRNRFRFCPESDPSLFQPSGNGLPFDAEFTAKLLGRHAGKIGFDKIISVKRFHLKAPVYSVDCGIGYYMGSESRVNVLQGNCWLTPVIDVQPQVENDPTTKKLFTDAKKKLVPDPSVYSDWFQSANDEDQEEAVGVTRLRIVREKIQDNPQWGHFLDPKTGRMMPIDRLRAETTQDMAERMHLVNDLLTKRKTLAEKIANYGYLPPEFQKASELNKPPEPLPKSYAKDLWRDKFKEQKIQQVAARKAIGARMAEIGYRAALSYVARYGNLSGFLTEIGVPLAPEAAQAIAIDAQFVQATAKAISRTTRTVVGLPPGTLYRLQQKPALGLTVRFMAPLGKDVFDPLIRGMEAVEVVISPGIPLAKAGTERFLPPGKYKILWIQNQIVTLGP